MLDASIKIFEIGLYRTGTRSLACAANILGYRAIHAPRTKGYGKDYHRKLIEGRIDFNFVRDFQYIGGCMALHWRQLAEAHPKAIFLLTVRDMDSWLRSMEKNLARSKRREARLQQQLAEGILDELMQRRLMMIGAVRFNKTHLVSKYHQHLDAVVHYFNEIISQPERLHVLNVCGGDGWNQLCPILDESVPDKPFPHKSAKNKDRCLRQLAPTD